MRIKRVICKSGLTGWQARLQDTYTDFAEFAAYCEIYGNHARLGYKIPRAAWLANPIVQGSVDPADYRKVKNQEEKTK